MMILVFLYGSFYKIIFITNRKTFLTKSAHTQSFGVVNEKMTNFQNEFLMTLASVLSKPIYFCSNS